MAEHESDEVRAQLSGSQTNPYAGYSGAQQGYSPYNYPFTGGYKGGGTPVQPYQGYQGGYQQGYQPYQQQAVSPAFTTPQTAAMSAPGMGVAGMPPSIAQQMPSQTSYIENILRLNAGKTATVYMTFEGSDQWKDKIFKGVIEAAGKDHIILRDPETERRYLLLMIYLDYITFESEINYFYAPAPQFFSVASS
ncbi:MAG TPA: spore coat protein GerQ [Bacillales bacterium]|nr:spore coat protein GerQ [Bacillales bacterium]